jgi:hypothetical protein
LRKDALFFTAISPGLASYAVGTARPLPAILISGGHTLKALMLVGIVVLVLGVLSFFVPFPHSEHHGVSIGDAHVGVTTHDDQKVPPVMSIVLVVVGAGLMIAGGKS